MCGPWGNGDRPAGWGSQRTRPALRGKGRAVGVSHWKGKDVKEMLQNVGDGLVTTSSHQATFMPRVGVIVHCALITTLIIITGIMSHCNYCLRRINHLVVTHHLHSSSGVREVVSSTRPKIYIEICLLHWRSITCSSFSIVKFWRELVSYWVVNSEYTD